MLTSTDTIAAYYNKYHRDDAVLISKERLLMVPIVIYLRKHSCLTLPINRHVEKLINGGIVDHWTERYRDVKYSKKNQMKTPQIMNMSQLAGIFYICCCLYSFAFCVLLLEIVWSIWAEIQVDKTASK